MRSSGKAANSSEGPSASPEITSRAPRWRPRLRRRWGRRSGTTACPPRRIAASDSRGRRISETCSSSSGTSNRTSAGPAAFGSPGSSTPRCGRSRGGSPNTGAASRSRKVPGGRRESDPAGACREEEVWKEPGPPARGPDFSSGGELVHNRSELLLRLLCGNLGRHIDASIRTYFKGGKHEEILGGPGVGPCGDPCG